MQDWKVVEDSIKLLLKGLDLTREDFKATPIRVTRMWKEFFSAELPAAMICPLDEELDLVMFKGHIFWGFCPHHLLPVKYDLTVGYVPHKKVLGASKPLRIADWITTLLPLQENIPGLICRKIEEVLKPLGTGCIVKGEHLCMRMRGVKSPCSNMITPLLKGMMLKEPYKTLFLSNSKL